MRISKKAEYAIHTVLYLCVHTEKAQQLGRLAEIQGVSKDYLAKVMQRLSGAEILSAHPGVGGGYRLAKDPHEITFADVMMPFEDPENTFSCLYTHRGCEAYPECGIIDVMEGAVSVFYEQLKQTTFGDLLDKADRETRVPTWIEGR